MTLLLVRIFFLILLSFVGSHIGLMIEKPILGLEMGVLFGVMLIFLEQRMRSISIRGLSAMVFGLLLGVFMAKLISDIIELIPLGEFFHSISRVILTIVFSYLGVVMALRGKDEFHIIIPYVRFKREDANAGSIIVDTSAIIDGRIADIYKTHFMTGRLVVPRCVLNELQKLSDSANDIKRQRGRRGMELLRIMQADSQIEMYIHEDEITGENQVDAKLMTLAKLLDARICTTDFNLGRVASLQKIEVLNIHELVSAVKSAIFTGETLEVKLIKEGKEQNQALAYMEDGTMIVVGDARHLIGKKITVCVTSVLQTQSGKMVFAKIS